MKNEIQNIEEFIEKLAIADALYRYAAGIDMRSIDLIKSALAEDAVSDFGPAGKKAGFEYPVLEGAENIATALIGSLKNMDTSHSVSNVRVGFEGNKAIVDALVEAQHVPSNDSSRHYLMKNRYDVAMVKQNDIWVIQRVTVDNIWRTGDSSVLSGI